MRHRLVRARDAAKILAPLISLVRSSMSDPNLRAEETWRTNAAMVLQAAAEHGGIELLLDAREEERAFIVGRWQATMHFAMSRPDAIIAKLPANADERAVLAAVMTATPLPHSRR